MGIGVGRQMPYAGKSIRRISYGLHTYPICTSCGVTRDAPMVLGGSRGVNCCSNRIDRLLVPSGTGPPSMDTALRKRYEDGTIARSKWWNSLSQAVDAQGTLIASTSLGSRRTWSCSGNRGVSCGDNRALARQLISRQTRVRSFSPGSIARYVGEPETVASSNLCN